MNEVLNIFNTVWTFGGNYRLVEIIKISGISISSLCLLKDIILNHYLNKTQRVYILKIIDSNNQIEKVEGPYRSLNLLKDSFMPRNIEYSDRVGVYFYNSKEYQIIPVNVPLYERIGKWSIKKVWYP